jgi:DNA-binding NarL/FixJ family response regulator
MQPRSILIVDDSEIIVDRLTNLLKDSKTVGRIAQAADYATAVRQLALQPVDVALLDINLPGRNGIVLLQFIKTVYPSTVVIMITNQSGEYYQKICRQMGADYFIDKSGQFDQVLSVISSLPDTHR